MKLRLLSSIILLSASLAFGQCGSIVDNAKVLDTSSVQAAIDQADNAGADAHVFTSKDLNGAPNMDQFEASLEKSCPDWYGASGTRKNNLVVLMVATQAHKIGLYYGATFHKALDGQWPDIQADMKPKLRDKDFTGAMVLGLNSVTDHVKAAAQVHNGATTIVNEKPADLSGLWSFLKWTLLVALLVALALWVYFFFARKREKKDDLDSARAQARKAKANADDNISQIENALLSYTGPNHDALNLQIQGVRTSFDRLNDNGRFNIETMGSVGELNQVRDSYVRISAAAQRVSLASTVTDSGASAVSYAPKEYDPVNDPPVVTPSASEAPEIKRTHHRSRHTTVVNNYNNDSGYIPVPVVISDPGPVYSRPSYTPPSSNDDSYSSSSSSSSDSGGSSSWSSSDSSSDYGGSSSFDSGSSFSDSGGGGSTDW